jgi:hypothetical protein
MDSRINALSNKWTVETFIIDEDPGGRIRPFQRRGHRPRPSCDNPVITLGGGAGIIRVGLSQTTHFFRVGRAERGASPSERKGSVCKLRKPRWRSSAFTCSAGFRSSASWPARRRSSCVKARHCSSEATPATAVIGCAAARSPSVSLRPPANSAFSPFWGRVRSWASWR